MDSQSATQTGSNGLKRGQAGSDRVKRGHGDDRIGALRTDSDPKTAPERRRAAAVADPGHRKKRAGGRAARRAELTMKGREGWPAHPGAPAAAIATNGLSWTWWRSSGPTSGPTLRRATSGASRGSTTGRTKCCLMIVRAARSLGSRRRSAAAGAAARSTGPRRSSCAPETASGGPAMTPASVWSTAARRKCLQCAKAG